MTGFSAEWLALREGADHRARNVALADAVRAHFANRDRVTIVDLACGAGSNLRGLAPRLGARQQWRLVDHDPRLLEAARAALVAWADAAKFSHDAVFRKDGREIDVTFEQGDLSALSNALFEAPADLVTAAAFFDLASEEWISQFSDALARARLPLYAVLSYSGEETWLPEHPNDADMRAAFHAHQATDKGFGAAAGPRAATMLARDLAARGYRVLRAQSPWRLDARDAALIGALADGAARAVQETGLVAAERIDDWRRARRAARACVIGHVDIFATPMGGAA